MLVHETKARVDMAYRFECSACAEHADKVSIAVLECHRHVPPELECEGCSGACTEDGAEWMDDPNGERIVITDAMQGAN